MEMKATIDYVKVIPALYEDPSTKEFVCCNVCGATLYKHGLDPVRHRNGFCNIDKTYYKKISYITSKNILYYTEMVNGEEYLFFVHPTVKKKGRRKKWDGRFEYELDYACPLSAFKISNLEEGGYRWYLGLWMGETLPLYPDDELVCRLQNQFKQDMIDTFMKEEYRKKMDDLITRYPFMLRPKLSSPQVKVTYHKDEKGKSHLIFRTAEVTEQCPFFAFDLSELHLTAISAKYPDSKYGKKGSRRGECLLKFDSLERGETSNEGQRQLLRQIYSILTDKKITFIYEKEDLEKYYKEHPYDLGEATYFAKGGKNVFLPAFAPAYHIVLEKMVKLGLHYADHFLDYEDLFNLEKTSMKDILGFPLKVEGGYQAKDIRIDRDYIKTLQIVQKSNPELLNRTHFSSSLMRFWMLKHEIKDIDNEKISLQRLKEISVKDERKICTYLENLMLVYFNHYIGYLNLYYENKEAARRKFSLTPEDLEDAYDDLKQIDRERRRALQPTRKELFQEKVEEVGYQMYTTDCWEDPGLIKSEYMILAPTSPEDLREAGNTLHNCLYSYCDSVIKGSSIILYLCKKVPYKKLIGALEINGKYVKQALGNCNEYLEHDERAFLKQWAAVYGLSYRG